MTDKPTPAAKAAERSPAPAGDPLDHDGDGKKGGSAPIPEVQHLVVTQDDPTRGIAVSEVLAVSDADARALLKADVAREATPAEVELAQPRVRAWASA